MSIFSDLKEKLQANPKTIVFTEGTDERILSSAENIWYITHEILNFPIRYT